MTVSMLRSAGTDLDVADGARVSVGRSTVELSAADEALIRRLVRDSHTEPLRGVWFKFRFECSIGCARQVMTNKRYLAINERSTRYSEFPDEFIFPLIKRQIGKKMEYQFEPLDTQEFNAAHDAIQASYDASHAAYRCLLGLGVAREDARSVLPLGTKTALIVSGDLVAWLRFLSRRADPHAQDEIRALARAVEMHIQERVPITHAAWNTYGRKAL